MGQVGMNAHYFSSGAVRFERPQGASVFKDENGKFDKDFNNG